MHKLLNPHSKNISQRKRNFSQESKQLSLETIDKKILNFLRQNGKTFRKNLVNELGICARNINRSIDKLLLKDEIVSDKQGREVYYDIKPNIPFADMPHVEEALPATHPSVPQIDSQKTRKTKAEIVVDYLKTMKQEVPQKELQALAHIISGQFMRKLKSRIQKGEVAFRRVGRENVWWYVSDTPIAKRKQETKHTKLEVLVNRITPLQEFSDHLKAAQSAKGTVEEYCKKITHFYQFKSRDSKTLVICSPERFTLHDFDTFVNHCQEDDSIAKHCHHYSENAVAGVYTALKKYFKFLFSSRYIINNFLVDRKVPPAENKSKVVGLTIKEFMRMLNATKSYRDSVMLLFLLATGARASEVEAFKLSDINWQKNQIVIHGKKAKMRAGKATDRLNDIPPSTMEHIKTYIEKHRGIPDESNEQAVFLNEWQAKLKVNKMERIIRKLTDITGIQKHIVVHSFRHACCTLLYANGKGWDIKSIAKQVGHKKVEQTWAYIIDEDSEKSETYHQQVNPLAQMSVTSEIAQIITQKGFA